MTHTTKIFGPPGTGKTTKLISIVEEALAAGISPDRIAYVSFSTKAAQEAISRASKKFNIDEKEFKYFRTIHSLGFQNLKLRRDEVMDYSDYKSIADELRIEISKYTDEDEIFGSKEGDNCRTIHDLSRARMISLEDQWKQAELQVTVPYATVEQWAATIDAYKKKYSKNDFADMLEKYSGSLPVDILIVDEAQDLSKLQWEVVRRAMVDVPKVYIAGDDDQCIYTWNGADVDSFLNFPVDEEILLPKSWRMPTNILEMSKNVAKSISHRKQKEFTPAEHTGEINLDVDLYDLDISSGEWLFLIRNKKFSREIERFLQEKGVVYFDNKSSTPQRSISYEEAKLILNWELLRKGYAISMNAANDIIKSINKKYNLVNFENVTMENITIPEYIKNKSWFETFTKSIKPYRIEYIRSCLRNRESITQHPRITISTIHRSKGGECENVVICPDYSYLSSQFLDHDDEHRVQYVAITRARHNLHILKPNTEFFYEYF